MINDFEHGVPWDGNDDDEAMHVWPIEEKGGHIASKECLCDPLLEFKAPNDGKEFWVHFPLGKRP